MSKTSNRSTGNVNDYVKLILAGNTLEKIGKQYGISGCAVGKALKSAGLPTNSRRLLQVIPEGCTPTDAEVLRAANHKLIEENHKLRSKFKALKKMLHEIESA